MKISSGSGVMAGLMIAASAAAQHSVWLPEKDHIVITPSYVYQTFDHFWAGNQKVKMDGDMWQHTAFLGFDYGVTDDTAIDATVGWVWSETDSPTLGANGHTRLNDDGLTDTTFGIRQRFVDENDYNQWWIPSLALRVGGIIKGTYDPNFPFSAGDGASGVEGSLLVGKSICPGFGTYGDIGYRYRDGHVPDDLFGSGGIYLAWKFLSGTVGYRFTKGLSGMDIGDPGFTFPKTKEISQNVEASLGFTDPGGRYYQVFAAHTFSGRNTGERDILGGAISLTF